MPREDADGVGPVTGRRVVAGRYRLEERIGSGAMGVVWRGTDERLGRVVAVKQVFLHGGLDDREADEVRQRTLREGRIAARLQHPHAISVFDASIEGDEPWLVMEYLPSRSLAAVLGEQGPLDPRLAARVGRQLADALDAAHTAGIVHRDVKPGNVLIGSDGTVKITDFGISRATGDLTLTRTGMLAGTPAYLAPEVARGADPTSASDVFSLGATLYATVEGIPPFGTDDNALALLHSVAAGRIVPPVQAGPLTALLMRLLRDDPTERPTAAEARAALGRIAHTGGGDATIPGLAAVMAEPAGADAASGWSPPVGPSPDPAHRSWPDAPGSGGSAGPGVSGGSAGVSGSGGVPAGRPAATRRAMPVPTEPDRETAGDPGSRSDAGPGHRPGAPPPARDTAAAFGSGPAGSRSRRRRPTLAVAVAVLAVALIAGLTVGVALLGSSGTGGGTGASVGEAPTSEAPTDPREQMVAAVRDYYTVVTGNNAAGWARLGPGLQAEAGGFSAYQSFWSTISSVRVVEARAVDADTVRATIEFVPDGRSASQEVHELGMVRADDGRWLIDSDDRVEAASPRAATSGLDRPVASSSAPSPSSPPPTAAPTPPSPSAAVAAGRDRPGRDRGGDRSGGGEGGEDPGRGNGEKDKGRGDDGDGAGDGEGDGEGRGRSDD